MWQVHVWQYNGNNTAPGGLIEGIADWVRLKDGFIPPHWSRGGDSWDDGFVPLPPKQGIHVKLMAACG